MEQQILTSIINAGVGGAIAALIIYLIISSNGQKFEDVIDAAAA